MFFIALPLPEVLGKVSVLNRVAAKLVDIGVILAMGLILPYPLGPLVGFFYSLFADGLNFGPFKGQSVGKRLLGLKVVHVKSREPANLRDSALRNAPVGVATFFSIIPIWGWLILALIGLPLMLMEIYLMASVATGHRLGDVMGDTEVMTTSHKPGDSDDDDLPLMPK